MKIVARGWQYLTMSYNVLIPLMIAWCRIGGFALIGTTLPQLTTMLIPRIPTSGVWALLPLVAMHSLLAQGASPEPPLSKPLQQVLGKASEILESGSVAYVFGGHRVGDSATCQRCQDCLRKQRPSPESRSHLCPACSRCSLDCSHFIHFVFKEAGHGFPYLTSRQMAELPKTVLRKRYGLIDIPTPRPIIQPADFLVYKGHVVLVERVFGDGRGDVIHATGAGELARQGQGIQRARRVLLSGFKGPLRRVLRHHSAYQGGRARMRKIDSQTRSSK